MMHMGFRVVVEFGVKEFTPPDVRALITRIQNDGLLIERDKAVASLKETVRSRPKDPELLLRLARALAAQGKCDEAFGHFTSVMEITRDDQRFWGERALLDAKRGQWSKAAATYTALLKGRPETLKYELQRSVEYAYLLLLAGDRDRYRQVCEGLLERLERNPDPGSGYYVARICALSPDTAIDPARMVRQAELLVPVNPPSLHVRGLAHYRAGQFDLALRRLDESLTDVPSRSSQPVNWVVLAMVHHRLGHAAEARRYLDKFDGWMDQSANAVPYAWGGFPLHPHDWMACLVLRREAEALLSSQIPNKP